MAARTKKVESRSNQLAAHWLLIALGVLLLALGCILALATAKTSVTISALVMGAAAITFAAVLSRMEGPFRFGADGLSGTLSRAKVLPDVHPHPDKGGGATAVPRFPPALATLKLPELEILAPTDRVALAYPSLKDSPKLAITENFSMHQYWTVTLQTGEQFRVEMPLKFRKQPAGA